MARSPPAPKGTRKAARNCSARLSSCSSVIIIYFPQCDMGAPCGDILCDCRDGLLPPAVPARREIDPLPDVFLVIYGRQDGLKPDIPQRPPGDPGFLTDS